MDARILGILSAVALSAWAAPQPLARVDFRATISEEMIVLEKESPAYAAFEDAKLAWFKLVNENNIEFNPPAERLVLVNAHEKIKTTLELQLKPQIVSRTEKVDHLAELVKSTRITQEMSPVITFEDVASVLVKEELDKKTKEIAASSSGTVRKIKTQSGEPIIVSKPAVVGHHATRSSNAKNDSNTNISDSNRRKVWWPSRVPAEKKKRIAKKEAGEKRTEKTDTGDPIKSAGFTPSVPSRRLISGPITFTGGAALLGHKDIITAVQTVDNVVVAEGYVDHKEARYEVPVDDLSGEILTELRGPDGQVSARGRLNLLSLAPKHERSAKIQNIEIKMTPVFNGVSASIISSASHGKSIYKVADARMFIGGLNREIPIHKETGLHEDSSIMIPSNYVARVEHPRFWPTISMAESGETPALRIFPRALVEALLNITLKKYEAREALQQGVIWGRVTHSGRTIEGAEIRIIGEESQTATYFSGFIPDRMRTATGPSGEFAFTKVHGAEKLIQVSLGSKAFWPVMQPVEAMHIGYAELEIQPPRWIELKSYDAFSHQELATVLQPLGTSDQVLIPEKGVSRIEISGIRGLSFLESDPGAPYVLTRSVVRSAQTEVHFMGLKSTWLEGMRKSKKLEESQVKTAMVGFLQGDDYEVLLGSGEIDIRSKIIYFDAEGKPVNTRGVAGGGFVIFDLPPGIHTLTILPEKSKKIVTQTVYVDEFAVQQIRTNLML